MTERPPYAQQDIEESPGAHLIEREFKGAAVLDPNGTGVIFDANTGAEVGHINGHRHFTHRDSRDDPYYDTHRDFGKPRFSLIPAMALRAMAKVMSNGFDKYGGCTWKQTPDGEQRYTESFLRHAVEILQYGPRARDEESGHLHLAHCLCDGAFAIWFMCQDGEEL